MTKEKKLKDDQETRELFAAYVTKGQRPQYTNNTHKSFFFFKENPTNRSISRPLEKNNCIWGVYSRLRKKC